MSLPKVSEPLSTTKGAHNQISQCRHGAHATPSLFPSHSLALIMHPDRHLLRRVSEVLGRSKDVHCQPIDGGQEDLEVVPGKELGVGSARVLEEGATQKTFRYAEALSYAG